MHEQSPVDGVSRPRVGVTGADDPTPDNYVAAVRRCGGEPIVLANDAATIDDLLTELCGIIVTGGSDIDPMHYGASLHATTKTGDHARDDFEIALMRAAFERGTPTLAVCRGLQIANVAWGGTLHQHLPEIVGDGVVHHDPDRKYVAFAEHLVEVDEDSLLFRTVGQRRFATNATHHQAVDRIALGLRVTARTADGIIEALECPTARSFWLATQWHPERLLDADDGRSLRIFEAFIAATREKHGLTPLVMRRRL